MPQDPFHTFSKNRDYRQQGLAGQRRLRFSLSQRSGWLWVWSYHARVVPLLVERSQDWRTPSQPRRRPKRNVKPNATHAPCWSDQLYLSSERSSGHMVIWLVGHRH